MPRRKAKSVAASRRNAQKQIDNENKSQKSVSSIIIAKDDIDHNLQKTIIKIEQGNDPIIISDDDINESNNELRIEYIKHISGHFHQGDIRFSEESSGRQCSCNALVMLCRIPAFSHDLKPDHLDQILIDGDYLYRSIVSELRKSDDIPESGYLAHDQLPPVCVLSDNSTYEIEYDPVTFCIYEHDETNNLQPLDVELQRVFNESNSIILILDSYMMSVYKDCLTGYYIFFDSHSRNEFGFVACEGNSVALVFCDFHNLYNYLKVLCNQLKVTDAILGIQAVQIKVISESCDEYQNQPGCSFWTTNEPKLTAKHLLEQKKSQCVPFQTSKLSNYQKWYQSLSTSQQNDILAQKRKRSEEQYAIQSFVERKRLKAREQSKESYQNPENAQRKRNQAREQSKESYQNPENAQRKRNQAREQSKESYQNPENAQRKRNQAREQSKQSYQNPENAQRKREQSKESYQNPENAQRKRNQAREQSKQSYQNPENARRKREQSKQSYQNPENAQRKREQSHRNRHNKKTNIADVIANFQIACKTQHQLIYICQICQRIFFRRQVIPLYKSKYNRSILLESLPYNVNINSLPIRDRDNQNQETMWICYTCHKNLLQKHVPTLATVNKLSLVEQPHVLSQLNMLERHLISPAILFMKMIPLIKGAQKGINGQVVCVKSNINNTATCLPRLPTEQSLIRVKLKRQLKYKGHHMCQDISPEKIRQALSWLKAKNPVFADIDIDFTEFDCSLDDQLIANKSDQRQENDMSTEATDSDDTEIYEMGANINDTNEDENDNNLSVNNSKSTKPTDSVDTEIYEMETNTNDTTEDVSDDVIHGENNQDVNENDDEQDNVTNTSAPLFSFLHPVDFAQYLADKRDESILCIAPGEGNTPELVLQMEGKCFPVEFPDGSNTFNEEREHKLSPSRYFNARIFSADNRFARNPEFIFFALYATEVQQIWDNICIAMRTGNTKTSDGKEITASMLTDHEQVKQLIRKDQGYRFLKKIRGTPAFWENSKKDVFAMLRQLGIPTFFLTFSAADRRWMDIDNAILILQGKRPMTVEEHDKMAWEEHCNIIMSNPAVAARMFQERINSLIKDVILAPANPIGKVEDYYYRIEFQQRGWPHIHMITWVKDAPVFDEDSDEDITDFIDRYISCELPPEEDNELHDIVSNVQMHAKRHTKSCRKTGKVCRFNFPKPPANKTFISRPRDSEDDQEERESNAKDIIQKLWNAIEGNEDADFDQILHDAQLSHSQFESALSILANRNTVYLKRRSQEAWVNNYNPHLIRCWNGNMDIQYVLDSYAAAAYMCAYLTKSERDMGDLLRNAQREAREGNADAISELKKLGSVYLQHREVSVMGAIYLTCSMPLKQSSRYVKFIQTDVDGQRLSLPLRELQENAGNSEEVWKTTDIEKYIGRPTTPKYTNMCMAKFFSTHYQISTGSRRESNTNDQERQSDDEDHDNTDEKGKQNTNVIKLKNCKAKMKERTKGKPAVIRYPRVSIKRDKERYHMNMLRLYLPHTTTEIKPESFDTYESYHLTGTVNVNGEIVSVREIVKDNMQEFEPDNNAMDNALEALQEIPEFEDAWNAHNPQNQQHNSDDELNRVMFDDLDENRSDIEIPEFRKEKSGQGTKPRCAIETCRPQITEEQAQSMMRQLNDKQRQIFNYATKWCNEKVKDHTVRPFHIFVTGGAGTGKSHVIKCINYYANKTFAPMTEDADQVTVLLLAHTGTAAFNIFGETICSALKVPAKTPHNYVPLSEESLNTLRVKYCHLQLVIIDEISMVSVPQLDYIHGRLQQIKGTSSTSYFGNVSVLAVGDFYQLPPISPRTPLCFPRDEILKDLWNTLFQIVELTEIMRQRDDAIFAQMLNRLRTRKKKEPLKEEDKCLLESRVVSMNDDLSAPDDALHLFFRNVDVNEHNDKKLSSLNTQTYTVQAIDVDQKGGQILEKHSTPHKTTPKDDTTLADEVKLAVNARVMLISNVDVSDGLCNGVTGIVKGIEFSNDKPMPTVVYVKFDSNRIGRKARSTEFIPPHYDQCIPIKPRKESFQLKKLKGKIFTTTREQIPLKLSWAVTIHKVQGQTTDQAVISMKGLQKAMAYVALSRVTHLDGMYLTDFDEKRILCDDKVETYLSAMTQCDMSVANPLLDVDHVTNFIVLHHNIQSLNAHLEDMKTNSEIRKAHVICLSETWLETDHNYLNSLNIDGYTLETLNSGRGRGVAMYIQNSVNYEHIFASNGQFDLLAIRTTGNTKMLITVIYNPVTTTARNFSSQITDLLTQFETLDTDYTVFVGDFNHDLLKHPPIPAFDKYNQLIQQPTTSKGTLLDHIYVKPLPQQYSSSSLTTYYSYHEPTFVAIKR